MSGKTIVAVCGDAGGAAAVAPVVARLREAHAQPVRAVAYGQAPAVWRRTGIDHESFDGGASVGAVAAFLRSCGAGLVLAGTSVNDTMLEQRFLAAARTVAVPTLSVLDSWVNYSRRFGGARAEALPDRIAIMDTQAREDMIAEGFDEARLVVTGQPSLDALGACRAAFTPAVREAVRRSWGLAEETRAVLFVSQPFSALKASSGWADQGFDERTVLAALVGALDGLAERGEADAAVVVRPHPREDSGWMRQVASRSTRVVVDAEGDPRTAAMSADLVAGMNSILLLEACLLECITISLQPGLIGRDVLPTNRSGQSRAVYHVEGIPGAVRELLLDDDVRTDARRTLARSRPAPGATERVVELAAQLMSSAANIGGVR